MNTDRIDFISSYCDRWCERCAYTSRCSAFAATAAIAMCGDVRDGLQLAVGQAQPVDPERKPAVPKDWLADAGNIEMTENERREFDRREQARDARVRDASITKLARAWALLSHRWLTARCEGVRARAEEVLREALEVALHDVWLVSAKLHRALDGLDRYEHEDEDDHPIQNDWNGSAKVALICLERSEAAWRVIAQATGEATPALLACHVGDLRRQVEDTFPNARAFVRPGFDEPGC